MIVMGVMSTFRFLAGTGLVLLIISGIAMMYATGGVFHGQLWFNIKLFIVLLIILNTLVIAPVQGKKLRKLLQAQLSGSDVSQEIQGVRSRLSVFYISQLILLLLVFFLSAYRFN